MTEDEENEARFLASLTPISSNHYSVDQQLEDAVSYLADKAPDDHARFLETFPEWERRRWQPGVATHFDTTTMGVDEEWSNWAIDWLEDHTFITWYEGEPYWQSEVGT